MAINKLYYGNGNCSIEGDDVRAVQIKYIGAIQLTDKTSDSFAILHRNNKIVIFPIEYGILNDLFDYIGTIKINSVIASDSNGKMVSTTVHRVMDYAELLDTNAEDMTSLSEDLSASNVFKKRVFQSSSKKEYIENQHTSENTGLFLKDGTEYYGYFHIHLRNGMTMTGNTHSEDSENLYINRHKVVTVNGLESTEFKAKKPKVKRSMTSSKKIPINRKFKKPKSGSGGY